MACFPYREHRATMCSGKLLRVFFALASLWLASFAQAACFQSADPAIRDLQTLAARDATATLPQVQARLDVANQQGHPEPAHLASLLAVQAQSYSVLELDGDARASALAGLKLVPDANNSIRLELLSLHAENVYDHAGIDAATKSIEAALARQPPDSIAESCLRITLGILQTRQDHADLAIVNLMHAYESSVVPGRLEQRMLAASALSSAMRDMGDYAQALALNAEVIDWNTAQSATLSLSVSRYLRGTILTEIREFPAAIEEFKKARELSVTLKDAMGVAFADLDICGLQIDTGELKEARRRCNDALRVFAAAGAKDVAKQAGVSLARIDLQQGHPSRALTTLNDVLRNGGADMPPRRVPPIFKLRSRANAALGNFADSYLDLNEYLQRQTAVDEARRVRQAATLRARFETDRQLERNAELKRELATSRERQAQQKRWTGIAAGTGAIVIALLMIQINSIRRHRRQLAVFANQDSLTGLPNRRHAYELAIAAMEQTRAAQVPLTVVLIDLDHFKNINDRCGHAAGDNVLIEFALACRASVRDADVLGRWGGEEFLLVMPGASLETALIALERLRALALGIQLPATGAGLRVCLSAGLATFEPNVKSLDELIASADAALYQAKRDGRDRVRIADESMAAASSGLRRTLRESTMALRAEGDLEGAGVARRQLLR
jgi:diguanylate cyclase (GGDEF)-like protein